MKNHFFKTAVLRLLSGVSLALLLSLGIPGESSATGGHFTGTFDPNLGLTVVIYPEGTFNAVPSMNFGTLVPFTDANGGHLLRGGTGFVVYIYPQVNYIYQIYCTGTPLTNAAGNTLPAGACVVTPVYSPADNGGLGMPAGSSVGPAGTWVTQAHHVIYNDTNGEYRAIQAHFAIREDIPGATAAILDDQPAGAYSGTVTFTAVDT